MSEAGENDQDPTALRLQQAKRTGDVPRSNELAAILSLLGAIVAGYLTLKQLASWLEKSTISLWSNAGRNLSGEQTIEMIQTLLFDFVGLLLPFSALLIFFSTMGTWIQTGPMWLPSKVAPTLENLGPGKWRQQVGLPNIISMMGLGVPKIVIGLSVMGVGTWYHRNELFSLGNASDNVLPERLFAVVFAVCLYTALALVAIGLADFGIQWVGYRRRMRMSHQEIKEERRQGGDDSVTRARRRQPV